MTTLTQASAQWFSRPSDERFTSLTALRDFKYSVKRNSRAKVMANRDLRIEPVGDDHKGLQVVSANGAANMTHWSFGQLASLGKAPAGYLRTLPSEMAADCMNYGLQVARDIEDVGVLVSRDIVVENDKPVNRTMHENQLQLRAATGPAYGRIWDADVVDKLIEYVGDGVSGDWTVPGEFGKAVEVNKQNTTLYASDRDMFVFLADEKNRIEIPNRRNGESGSMARGFFVKNSEVGSATFSISTFLFDYVCMNRIVWGARDVQTVNIRHSSGAPHRFLEEAVPALEAYSQSSAQGIVHAITEAKAKRIDDVDAFLAKRFTRSQAVLIKATHEAEEGRPIESLWDVTTGVTAVARTIQHQDARVELETKGGDILDLVA